MSARHIFTDEEKSWLASQDPSLSYKQLTAIFNEKYETNVTWYGIRDLVGKKLGIKRSSNCGQFKDGHEATWRHPVGTERIFNGYTWVKIRDDVPDGMPVEKVKDYQWQLKSRYIWEQAYGPLEDRIVIFLDGDRQNNDLSNLYAVNRGVHAIMCKNKWYSNNPYFTKVAIRTAELIKELASIKKGNK